MEDTQEVSSRYLYWLKSYRPDKITTEEEKEKEKEKETETEPGEKQYVSRSEIRGDIINIHTPKKS